MKIEELGNKNVALATVGKNNKPHNIVVEVNCIKEGKIVITDNYMKSTIQNLKSNPYVSLIFLKNEDGWRINGRVKYFNSGEWLNFVKSLPENKGHPAKGALIVEVEEIRELG